MVNGKTSCLFMVSKCYPGSLAALPRPAVRPSAHAGRLYPQVAPRGESGKRAALDGTLPQDAGRGGGARGHRPTPPRTEWGHPQSECFGDPLSHLPSPGKVDHCSGASKLMPTDALCGPEDSHAGALPPMLTRPPWRAIFASS